VSLGLKAAIARVFAGASWQRCRVHFMCYVLARVPKASSAMVAALVRTTFAQPDGDSVRNRLDDVAERLEPTFPAVAELFTEARDDLCAFASFPTPHWPKIWSTNSIERLNG